MGRTAPGRENNKAEEQHHNQASRALALHGSTISPKRTAAANPRSRTTDCRQPNRVGVSGRFPHSRTSERALIPKNANGIQIDFRRNSRNGRPKVEHDRRDHRCNHRCNHREGRRGGRRAGRRAGGHEREVSKRLPGIGDRLTIRRKERCAAGSKALRFLLEDVAVGQGALAASTVHDIDQPAIDVSQHLGGHFPGTRILS